MGNWISSACRSGRVAVKTHVCFRLYIVALGRPGIKLTYECTYNIINWRSLKMIFEVDASDTEYTMMIWTSTCSEIGCNS